MIKYKDYIGNFEFVEEKHLFYGKVSNIEDLVTFQEKSVKEVKDSFEDAVNEYIAWCQKYRNKPDKNKPALKERNWWG